MPVKPLEPQFLYKTCEIEDFDFNSTAELKDKLSPIGQDRAISAVKFCIDMGSKYNMFCLGPEGTGKTSLVKNILKEAAEERPTPNDWCYVNNFDEPHKPKAISFPAGKAAPFAKDIDELIAELQVSIPAAFEGEEYRNRLNVIESKYKSKRGEYFEELQKKAKGKNVSLLRMPVGLVVAPMKDGEILSPEAFDALPENERKELMAELNQMQEELEAAVKDVPKWEKDQREEIKKLHTEVTNFAVQHLIKDLKKKYKESKPAVAYLEELYRDLLDNVDEFLEEEEEAEDSIQSAMNKAMGGGKKDYRHYQVNVLVKHEENEGAPIVFLDHPTHANIVGRVERQQQFGALLSDFNLIKSGALHNANGGFLLIDARKLITQPFSWDSLKRAIRSKEIKIESPGDDSAFSTVSLDPEPIPLDIKIILIGEAGLYYLLASNDPDFSELFKVEADFCSTMPRTKEAELEYAKLVASLSQKKGLRSLNKNAVARVIEHASRLAEDGEKLTAHIASISDLVKESDYWARQANSNIIGRRHVEQAIEAQIYRSDRVRESMQEQILRESVFIDTTGEKVGQINALVVYELGRICFGKPSRITCQARIGKGEFIDIEREIDMSGPSHSKGVLILQSIIANRFAKETPLSVSCSIAFEQSYGGVDGDSASSTEYYCLLSAIADIPIKQTVAVTGSVNQFGMIQPIGGVNEKIEGFFDICKSRGLTGEHAVVIPKSNVKNLMLRSDVIEAVKAGKFTVYAVETVDEGIEILTGIPAGARDEKGEYPIGTVNRKVEARLKQLYKKSAAFASEFEGKNED